MGLYGGFLMISVMKSTSSLLLSPLQVSADGEIALYQACQRAGITLLSIAHRPALRSFHSVIVHFDGSHAGAGYRIETMDNKTSMSTSSTDLRTSVSSLLGRK